MDGSAAERELIHLVETLWEIECRHLLGSLSPPEYRKALAAALSARLQARPLAEMAMEVNCE